MRDAYAEDLQISKYVGTRMVVAGQEALQSGAAGVYYCKVCECHLRDSQNYLAHINGRKHNRMLGMSMRAERSTLGEVRARLEAHKQHEGDGVELSKEEKAAQFLEQFEERLKQRDEEAKMEAAQKRREKREAAKQRGFYAAEDQLAAGAYGEDGEDGEGGSSVSTAQMTGGAARGSAAAATEEEEEGEQYVTETPGDDFAAMMGFGGFGGSKKTN